MKGRIIKSTGSWYAVLNDAGEKIECRIKGQFRMKGIRTTNPIAVGDNVDYELEDNNLTGVIVSIEPRKNYIIRRATKLSKQSHIIAANIDQAILLVTLAFPRTSTGFIDRFLVTAEAYHIPVEIVFNKMDLYSEEERQVVDELVNIYEPLGYGCLKISALSQADVEQLKGIMKDRISLISGHSGVGKSTLINVLQPGLNLKVREISDVHGKGMHTTTFAEMIGLDFGGFIIDTPGIKEFGIIDFGKEELSHYFPEMRDLIHHCRFNNCMHVNEPGCAVKHAAEEGRISETRYENYLRMLHSEEMEEDFS